MSLAQLALFQASYKCTDGWYTPVVLYPALGRLSESFVEFRQYNKTDVNHIKESVFVACTAMVQSHFRVDLTSHVVKLAWLRRTFKTQKSFSQTCMLVWMNCITGASIVLD